MIHPVKIFTRKNAFALIIFALVLTLWQLKLKHYLDDPSIGNAEDPMYIEKKYDLSGKDITEFAPVKVTVYYETMCPDSRNFFVNQLLPTYNEIPQLMLLDLVPYGKATTSRRDIDKFDFSCQHGEGECYGNKLHACAINAIQNQPILLKVLTCMISKSFSPDDSVGTCIKPSGLDVDSLISCARSSAGDKLLNYYGERTMKERPNIFSEFIPTVLLNDDYGKQSLRLKNLRREICAEYSKICSDFAEKHAFVSGSTARPHEILKSTWLMERTRIKWFSASDPIAGPLDFIISCRARNATTSDIVPRQNVYKIHPRKPQTQYDLNFL